MGNIRALYACPKFFQYYIEEKASGDLLMGRGLRQRLLTFFQRKGETVDLTDQRCHGKEWSMLPSSLLLRDYQKGDVEEIIKHQEGIIKLGTGYGKTYIALKVIETLLRAGACGGSLIVVPRIDIFTQFKGAIEKHFREGTLGVIRGRTTRLAPITLTTVQTLQRRIKDSSLSSLRDQFGIVIFDEAHQAVPRKTRQVVEAFNAKYLYGLTATPERTDGQGEAIKFIFGPIIIDKELPRKNPQVKLCPFVSSIPMSHEYARIIKCQTEHQGRNSFIAEVVSQSVSEGRKVLCLTKRVAHYEKIALLLKEKGVAVVSLTSGGTTKQRESALEIVRSSSSSASVICGTFSLLSVGVDIPYLDTLVIAGDLKSSVLTKQSVGRILRILQGKAEPLIIDIWDRGNKILNFQGIARQRKYKECGWPIVF